MNTKNEDLITLSTSEIIFLKQLLDKEYKSNNSCNEFRTIEKVLKLCKKLNVSSYEEIIRIADFYKLFEFELSNKYREYIELYSREKISITIGLRHIMFDIAVNAPEILCEICDNSHYFTMDDMQDTVKENIEKAKSDIDSVNTLNFIHSFINLFNIKHDFEHIFNNIFVLNDEEYEADAEKIVEYFDSISIKYLFIVRILISFVFPIDLKRELTFEEEEIVRFLLYNGDEIDYMKKTDMPPFIFKDKLKSIISAYSARNIHEMLITANLKETLLDSSLIYRYPLLQIRAKKIIRHKKDIIENISETNLNAMYKMIEKLELYLNDEIFSCNVLDNIAEMTEEFSESTFSINGKTEKLKEWFKKNFLDLNKILKLQILINQIEDILPNKGWDFE